MYLNRTSLIFRPGTRQIHIGIDDPASSSSTSSGTTTSSSSTTTSSTQSKTPITYTAEQQEHLQGMLDKRTAEIQTAADKKWQTKVDELTTRITELEKPKDDGKPDDKPGDGKTYSKTDLDAVRSQMEEQHTAKIKKVEKERDDALARVTTLLATSIENEILSAAAESGAYSAKQIYKLLKDDVVFDENGAMYVLNEKGTGPRIDTEGENLKVKDYVKTFVEANLHLKKGAGNGGAGSGTEHHKRPPDGVKLSPREKIAAGLGAQKG